MERYQSTRIGFVPKSSSFQHSTKVVPISNPQRKIQTNAFPPLDPSLISTFSINSFDKQYSTKNHDQSKPSLSISPIISNKDSLINSPVTKQKKTYHRIFIISLIILIMFIALTAMAISTYLFIMASRNTTTTTTTTTTTVTTTTTTTTTTSTSTTTTTTTSFYCPPVVYSVTFTSGVYSPILCSIWTSFTASLTCSNYTSFTLNGTYDPNGYTATDRTVVNGVAIALRTSTTYVGNSNGITWRVGSCGGSELTTTGSICQCATGNTLRPCVGGASFGGLASSSCSAPTQVITLSFE